MPRPTIENLLTLLRVAKEVSTQIPVPGLSVALEVALNIAEKAKDIRETRDACRLLAERAAYFSLGVYDQLKQCDSDSQTTATKECVTLLLCTLQDIEGLVKRRWQLRAFGFLWRHTKISEEVGKLNTQLEDAIKLFIMQTGVSMDQRMDVLMNTNVRLMQHVEDSAHVRDVLIGETRTIRSGVLDMAQRLSGSATFDGRFRLFAQENFDLVEPIRDSGAQQQQGRVVRYRAIVKAAGDLSGSQVVVHTYPGRESDQFVEAVKFAKQIYHPYILSTLGYSRHGDPSEAAYLVTEEYHPFEEYIRSFRGINKLRALLQMSVEMCMAADHLESIGPRQLLSQSEYWTYGTQYGFGLGELVFDRRHGGRVKWARGPLMLEGANVSNRDAFIPATCAKRARVLEALRSVASASAGEVVHSWISQILVDLAVNIKIPGRMSWQCWQVAMDRPRYTLGVWVGRNDGENDWSIVSTQNFGFEVVTAFPIVPDVIPWQGLSPDPPAEHFLDQKLRMARPFDVLDADLGELCADWEPGRSETKWKRYQFSCVPMDTTFIFRQVVHISDRGNAVSKLIRSTPNLSTIGYKTIGIVTENVDYTETTAAMTTRAAHSGQGPPPLWFFLLQYDGGNQGAAHDCNVPRGFWSFEKHPASIPVDVIFDSTPRFERVRGDVQARLFTWNQVLGEFTFTTQMKTYTRVLGPGSDELQALRELRENHDYYSNSGSHVTDWYTSDLEVEDVGVRDNSDHDNTDSDDDLDQYFDASEGDDELDQYFDASEGDEDSVQVHSPPAYCGAQDMTGESEDDASDDAEEYYSADED